jgi:hypothetical protein
VQIVKKGLPIEAKILAFVTLAIGVIQTIAITIYMIPYDSSTVLFALSTRILDQLHYFLSGVYFGNFTGGITEDRWIVAMGVITITIGFFMLRGYKLAWMASIALIGFRIATMGRPLTFFLSAIILNGIIVYLTFSPHTRRFFFYKTALPQSS